MISIRKLSRGSNKLAAKIRIAKKAYETLLRCDGKVATGVVLYEGNGFDGTPIVVIATFHSENEKTGDMIQVWIMSQNAKPNQILDAGKDICVCGDCPFRSKASGGNGVCYVVTFQGPRSIWETWKAGKYPRWNGRLDIFSGRKIRWGAYGEPSLIPIEIIRTISDACIGYTGYTHQWRKEWAQVYRRFFQASTNNIAEQKIAQKMGWGTFTVFSENDTIPDDVRLCLNVAQGTQCINCGMCNGKARVQCGIFAHGNGAVGY